MSNTRACLLRRVNAGYTQLRMAILLIQLDLMPSEERSSGGMSQSFWSFGAQGVDVQRSFTFKPYVTTFALLFLPPLLRTSVLLVGFQQRPVLSPLQRLRVSRSFGGYAFHCSPQWEDIFVRFEDRYGRLVRWGRCNRHCAGPSGAW